MIPRHKQPNHRRGSVIALVCFAMIVFIGMAALSVDVALMQLTRTQLRKASDAAARAASGTLAVTQDVATARQAAREVAAANFVRGAPVQLADERIVLGRSTYNGSSWGFVTNGVRPNAVRVTANVPGGLRTLFGGVLGVDRFSPEQPATAAAQTRDICLVIDRSGSMRSDITASVENQLPPGVDNCSPPHPELSRWGAVAIAVRVFLEEIDSTAQLEQVAFVTYSSAGASDSCGGMTATDTTLERSLVDDVRLVQQSLDARGQKLLFGRTNIAAGIDLGRQVVQDPLRSRRFADKVIVLLTDGIENEGRDSRDAAADARDEHITIHTITAGAGADKGRMAEVAAITGGEHLHAPTPEALREAFMRIARGIPSVLID